MSGVFCGHTQSIELLCNYKSVTVVVRCHYRIISRHGYTAHLVEDNGLADVSPVLLLDRGEEVEEDHDGNAGENGDAGKQDATKQY